MAERLWVYAAAIVLLGLGIGALCELRECAMQVGLGLSVIPGLRDTMIDLGADLLGALSAVAIELRHRSALLRSAST